MTEWRALALSALTSPSRNKCFHHFLEVVILIPVAIPASKLELLLGGKKNLEWRSSVPHRDSLMVKMSVSGVPKFWRWPGYLLQPYFLLLSLLLTLQRNWPRAWISDLWTRSPSGSQGLCTHCSHHIEALHVNHSLPLFKSLHPRRLPGTHYLKSSSSLLTPYLLLCFIFFIALTTTWHYIISLWLYKRDFNCIYNV